MAMIVMILKENRFERKSGLHGLSKALLFLNAAQKRMICRYYTQEVDDEMHAKLRPVDVEQCSLGWLQKLHCAWRIVFFGFVAKAKEVAKVRLLYSKGLASSSEQE